MTPFNTFLHALGTAGVDLSTGTYEILFTTGWTPNAADGGNDFEDDITSGGGTIVHRQVCTITWLNRVLDGVDFTVNDPGAGTATHAALIRQGVPSAATNRLIAHQDISDITFDGVNDQFRFNASGIMKIGA